MRQSKDHRFQRYPAVSSCSIHKENHVPQLSPVASLDKALSDLLKERQEHQIALAEIDAVIAKYGINAGKSQPAAKKFPVVISEKPKKPAAKKRRAQMKYPETAEQFVLSLLKGGKGVIGREINQAWKDSGRKGSADNTLSVLFKGKKVKRTPVKTGRGNIYSVV
jgi:hypothetical protein